MCDWRAPSTRWSSKVRWIRRLGGGGGGGGGGVSSVKVCDWSKMIIKGKVDQEMRV